VAHTAHYRKNKHCRAAILYRALPPCKFGKMHGKGSTKRTAKRAARQWQKPAHDKDSLHGNDDGHCRALPFAVHVAVVHGKYAFAVHSPLCRTPYGIFIYFAFYFISFNTYIYFFN
jgi:hypothetical protein